MEGRSDCSGCPFGGVIASEEVLITKATRMLVLLFCEILSLGMVDVDVDQFVLQDLATHDTSYPLSIFLTLSILCYVSRSFLSFPTLYTTSGTRSPLIMLSPASSANTVTLIFTPGLSTHTTMV